MAALVFFGGTGTGVGGFSMGSSGVPWMIDMVISSVNSSFNGTELVYSNFRGELRIYGTFGGFDAEGDPTTGTVTGFRISNLNGNPNSAIFEIPILPGISVPVASLFGWIQTNNSLAIESALYDGRDVAFGSSQSDDILTFGGNDNILAFGGDDRVEGGLGDDTIYGGAGNDLLDSGVGGRTWSGAGTDQLFGEDGDDTMRAGGGPDTLDGGAGVDMATILETNPPGAYATSLADLSSSAGATFASGAVVRNVERVTLYGSASDDVFDITGIKDWAGNNLLFEDYDNFFDARGGIDILRGDLSSYTVKIDLKVGFNSNERKLVSDFFTNLVKTIDVERFDLKTGLGADSLIGGVSDDTLSSGSGNDLVFGGDGADILNVGDGQDFASGGNGDDRITIDWGVSDGVDGGAGTDTLFVASNSGLGAAVSLRTPPGAPQPSITGIEHFFLSGFDDTFTGSDDAETSVSAGAGNDSLDGAGGDDVLNGEGGNDTLLGGAGLDTLIGGEGDDTYLVDSLSDAIVEAANQGADTIVGNFATYTIAANIENYRYTGTAAPTITGNDADNGITGVEGVLNTINGLGGTDAFELRYSGAQAVVATLAGITVGGAQAANLTSIERLLVTAGAGADSLTGGAGDDLLDGGAGIDTLNGGAGNDTYGLSVPGDIYIDTGGNDTIITQFVNVNIAAFAGIENVTLAGSINGDIVGDAIANVLTGNAGANFVFGIGGNDTINGGAGVDSLYGGADNDTINGDGEIDLLFGEIGADVIHGGAGNDFGLGGDGDDTLNGGADIDTLLGEAGDDVVNGDAGGDVLWGGLGIDTINGGDGLDYLLGQEGDDILNGGTDINVYVGGDGHDVMGSGLGLTGTTATQIFYGETGANPAGGGVAGNDSATGGSATDWFIMEAGDDTMRGGAGNDMFYGGDGNDLIDMSEGSTIAPVAYDYAWGHAGADTFLTQRGQAGVDVIMDFETGGGDVVRILGSTITDFSGLLAASFEANGFTIILLGGPEAVYLYGVTKAQLAADDFVFS